MRPDQSVKFAFGWLCARLIGLAALVVVAHGLLLRWAPALAGEQPLALVNIAITVCILAGILWGVAAVSAIPHGLPALHSLLVKGVPTTLQVSIVEIGGEINRRRCNRILHVRGSADFDSGTRVICDVPRQIWESARIGQTLTLVGHRSPYGLRYDEIRR